MKNIFNKIIIFLVLALVFSCSQDPIFYTISTEPIPVKPRIQGGPTNMAVFEREYSQEKVSIMYVASGNLHWYAKAENGKGAPGWDAAEYKIPQPGGKVIGLAATGEYLYALCIIGSGASTILQRIGPDETNWNTVRIETGVRYRLVQSIFTDKDSGRLFAGAMNNNSSDFGILYLDNTTNTLKFLQGDTEMLSGAASLGGFHYLSTRGKGVYKVAEAALVTGPAESDISQLPELVRKKDENSIEIMEPAAGNRLFMGMIQLEDGAIIVIERNGGMFFEVQDTGFTRIRYLNESTVASGRFATGALALWRQVLRDNADPQPGDKRMLVAGIQGGLFSSTTSSSFTHGYVEIELEYNVVNGWLVFTSTRTSISPDITVDTYTDRYTATIGKHPINYMYQASQDIDPNMTFFASTQTAGLWSYRNREGGLQWNAEGENEP